MHLFTGSNRRFRYSLYLLAGLFLVTLALIGIAQLQDRPETAQAAGTVYTVTSIQDSGPGTLREAIELANANPGKDTVVFAAPEDTITLTSPLEVTDSLLINGIDQSQNPACIQGYVPTVFIQGAGTFSSQGGAFRFTADDNEIYGLAIASSDQIGSSSADYKGALVFGNLIGNLESHGNIVQCNWLGLNLNQNNVGNSTTSVGTGIHLIASDNNLIGGSNSGEGNVFGYTGYALRSTNSPSNNTIQGNYFGVDSSGSQAVPNSATSVATSGRPEYVQCTVQVIGDDNKFGGSGTGEGNVLSGNVGCGLYVQDTTEPDYTEVQGNIFGLDAAASTAIPNTRYQNKAAVNIKQGVFFGGEEDGAGNIVAGNGHIGLNSSINNVHNTTNSTVIQGNYIGTNKNLDPGLGNAAAGIFASRNSLIGGFTEQAANVVAYNGGSGIQTSSFGHFIRFQRGNRAPTILQNRIFGNNDIGIDQVETLNDPYGSDESQPIITPNTTDNGSAVEFTTTRYDSRNQNYPTIVDATTEDDGILLEMTLNSGTTQLVFSEEINRSYHVEIFANEPDLELENDREGREFIKSLEVTLDSGGWRGFTTKIPLEYEGVPLTITATEFLDYSGRDESLKPSGPTFINDKHYFNTSEFGRYEYNQDFSAKNLNNSGVGSFREAVAKASANPGTDTVTFDVAGEIMLGAPITLYDAHVINGVDTTQNPVCTPDYNPTVALTGGAEIVESEAQVQDGAFVVDSPENVIAGLSLHRFTFGSYTEPGWGEGYSTEAAIKLRSDNNTIKCNQIGLNLDGNWSGNQYGIRLENSSGNIIGGQSSVDRNIISGNFKGAIFVPSATPESHNNIISHNYLGPDRTGQNVLANITRVSNAIASTFDVRGQDYTISHNVVSGNPRGTFLEVEDSRIVANIFGLSADQSTKMPNRTTCSNTSCTATEIDGDNNIIGGTNDGEGNIFAGEDFGTGLLLKGNSVVKGNFFGTNSRLEPDLGNRRHGLALLFSEALVGGESREDANYFYNNGTHGITVSSNNTINNSILGNITTGNARYGINLDGVGGLDGAANTDNLDLDDGANEAQNYPVINAQLTTGTTIAGTFNSKPDQNYRLELFANSPDMDISEDREGEEFVKAFDIATDSTGQAVWSVEVAPEFVGKAYTFTATEFSENNSNALGVNTFNNLIGNRIYRNTSQFGGAQSNGEEPPEEPEPGVSITKENNQPDGLAPGEIVTYSLRYRNIGDGPLSEVVLTDTLDPNLEYIENSCTPAGPTNVGCSYDENTRTLTWNIGNMPFGTNEYTAAFEARVAAQTATSVTMISNEGFINTAEINGRSGDNPVDINHPGPTPDIEITKEHDQTTSPQPGDVVEYTVAYANTGAVTLTGTELTDTLDVNFEYIDGSCTNALPADVACTYDENTRTLTWNPGELPVAQAEYTVSFQVRIIPATPDSVTTITNKAFLNTTELNGETTDVPLTVDHPEPDARLTLTQDKPEGASEGEEVTYTVEYENIGELELTEATLRNPLDEAFVYVPNSCTGGCIFDESTNTLTWDLGTIPTGDPVNQETFRVTIAPNLNDSVTSVENTVYLEANELDREASSLPVPIKRPGLELTKTYNETQVYTPGDRLEYVLSYANNGAVELTEAVLTDSLDENLFFVAGSCTPECVYDEQTRTVTWTIGTIPVGTQTQAYRFAVEINPDIAVPTVANSAFLNTAQIDAETNTTSTAITYDTDITNRASRDELRTGETVTFTITFENNSNVPLSNILIRDPLNPELEFVACSDDCQVSRQGDATELIWRFPSIASNATQDITFEAMLRDDSQLQLTNTAFLTSDEILTPREGSATIRIARDTSTPVTTPQTPLPRTGGATWLGLFGAVAALLVFVVLGWQISRE